MAQSYIEQVLNKYQFKELRNKLSEDEFSDCNEKFLAQADDEMEQANNNENKQKTQKRGK